MRVGSEQWHRWQTHEFIGRSDLQPGDGHTPLSRADNNSRAEPMMSWPPWMQVRCHMTPLEVAVPIYLVHSGHRNAPVCKSAGRDWPAALKAKLPLWILSPRSAAEAGTESWFPGTLSPSSLSLRCVKVRSSPPAHGSCKQELGNAR